MTKEYKRMFLIWLLGCALIILGYFSQYLIVTISLYTFAYFWDATNRKGER